MTNTPESLELSTIKHIDAICDRFEQAQQDGDRPRIEEFLKAETGPERDYLFQQLLKLDYEFASRTGKTPTRECYLARFPHEQPSIDEIIPSADIPETKTPTVQLKVIDGPHTGVCHEIDRHETLLVGRAQQAHLCLDQDQHFSHYHLRLEVNPPFCRLIDLSSRNGTLVNGKAVTEIDLNDGDVISGGQTKINVSINNAPEIEFDTWDGELNQNAHAPTVIGPIDVEQSPAEEILKPAPIIQTIPGYELTEELGRGAMGVVYKAVQQATQKKFALKVIVPSRINSTESLQLFLREANVLSQLRHPNIIRFHELGMIAGQVFLAMDFVEEISLDSLLQDRSEKTRLRIPCAIICDVLEALEYAHNRGFVHRDVKPANILLSQPGKKLKVQLSDFGLAKNFENAGFSGLTSDGEARGTLAYMPPEQVINCRFATPQCDIYAAGATLYRYLSGQLPYDFQVAGSKLGMILNEDPVPIEKHCPNLPDELVRVIRRSMARELDDRFQTAEEMRDSLMPFSKRKKT